REGEGVEQRRRYRPGDVEVVAREEEAVHDPVAASEGAVHPRQQVAAEQQLRAEHGGEDEQGDDEAVPAPGAVEERLPGVELDECGEDPVLTRQRPASTHTSCE